MPAWQVLCVFRRSHLQSSVDFQRLISHFSDRAKIQRWQLTRSLNYLVLGIISVGDDVHLQVHQVVNK